MDYCRRCGRLLEHRNEMDVGLCYRCMGECEKKCRTMLIALFQLQDILEKKRSD